MERVYGEWAQEIRELGDDEWRKKIIKTQKMCVWISKSQQQVPSIEENKTYILWYKNPLNYTYL